MEAEGRYIDLDDGESISLEYSHTQQHTSGSQTGGGLDWVCNMCQSINFARFAPSFIQARIGRQCACACRCRLLVTMTLWISPPTQSGQECGGLHKT